ncbi:4-hydroxyproline epimerase [Deinococcus metalli]|uniref:4-hydroxyproline 2-epimerase n=1 Tax=Deinococcus metalli TaxID=1141878 RepID=A0A7W8KCA9_9DEIO|nr:proline racemase family protein [Deinococcus metalli]MBB5375549.1 4-hydroxyproline epimerase [Deinococcus metalli]GHF28443.1 4-hydroxyproline 2-epimerase [Deinococcus metalli]
MTAIRFVDSHTAGEPTRVILSGFPALPGATLAEQRDALAGAYAPWARRVNNEPRGNDVLVSALLVPPRDPDCAAGVIYFNNVGPLGMCGHGTIGVVATLAHLGRIAPGEHRIETPVGVVTATLHPDGRVSVANVPAFRHAKDVVVDVPGLGQVRGDVAWGGNWFYLVDLQQPGLGGAEIGPLRIEELTDLAWTIRSALETQNVTGRDGAVIDHIELMGRGDGAHRNFVLCPGRAYDRSPCGTGTSAKLACLAADGQLAPGEVWRQESVIGSAFEGTYSLRDGEVHPVITGQAFITASGDLIVQDGDPFAWGIPG